MASSYVVGGVNIPVELNFVRRARTLAIPPQSLPVTKRVSAAPFGTFREGIKHDDLPLSQRDITSWILGYVRGYQLMDGLHDPCLLYRGMESELALAQALGRSMNELIKTDVIAALAFDKALRDGLFDDQFHHLMQIRLYWPAMDVQVVVRESLVHTGTPASQYANIRILGKHTNSSFRLALPDVEEALRTRPGTPVSPQRVIDMPKEPDYLFTRHPASGKRTRAVGVTFALLADVPILISDEDGQQVEACYVDYGFTKALVPVSAGRAIMKWLAVADGSPPSDEGMPAPLPVRKTLRRIRGL